ncbi:MAG TPA: hypothetical protein PLR99_12005 [Polyangiaceae bacterium]|nr:hypothetical protein [Polyangiaceae bacterium]
MRTRTPLSALALSILALSLGALPSRAFAANPPSPPAAAPPGPAPAAAQPAVTSPAAAPTPAGQQTIAVLGIDSDDAQDEADALADALKERARQAPGWVLLENSPSLGALTVSLKCSAKPDLGCQQKIAEAVKSDRYVWGVMAKAGGGGQVNVELHLYRRGMKDFVIRETYSDKLKNKDDARLTGLARRLFEELTGTSAARVIVRAGTGGGEVIVDGVRRVPVQNGTATIDVASGAHTIEIVVPGAARRTKQLTLQSGQEEVIEVDVDVAKTEPSKPFPTRTVVGGGLVVVGATLAVVSVVSGVRWLGLKGEESDLAAQLKVGRDNALSANDYQSGDPCDFSGSPRTVQKSGNDTNFYCDKDKSAKTASAMFIGFGVGALAAGGIGAYLLLTKPASTEGQPPLPKATGLRDRVKMQPLFGTTNGLMLSGSF